MITGPAGFRAAGVVAGLKPSGAPDLALVVNDGPLDACAGVFTSNRVQAAPVLWSRQVVSAGHVDAVVLNSGGANACTGPEGFADTHRTAEAVADALGTGAARVAVCSTGLIGVRLDMARLLAGVDTAVQALPVTGATGADATGPGGAAAAEAIRTTDTVAKTATATGEGWSVGGMAKGAAMLAPALATMLVVLTTDAVADSATLDTVLRAATGASFDRVDTDGCMSTNDTVLLLASGASSVVPGPGQLQQAVTDVCLDLAAQMVADAEGASKSIAVEVRSAASLADALEAARAVGRSNLLKCALHGQDPNWGRVLSAVGTTGAAFEPDRLDVAINDVQVCRAGAPGEPRELVDLTGRQVSIVVDLHAGGHAATIWTSDLTAEYVHENSAYST